MAWEPDRRSNCFSLPAHLCAVTCITEIPVIVMLSNQYSLSFWQTLKSLRALSFLAHLSRRLEWVFVKACCRSGVWHKLSNFRLFILNHWTELNKTWQEVRSQRPLPSLCFWADQKKQDGRPSLWLTDTFFTFTLKPLNVIQRNLTESNISTSDTKNVFFMAIGKQDGRPGLWLGKTFSTSSLKHLKRILRNLTGSKISTSSTKFAFFGPIRKTRWPSRPLIGLGILDFSETTKRYSTRLDRK